ncbi:adhesion G protein-coupled receptor L2-like [Hetaerina americana]|uniref:adhesion G protein-coupled receptor L2-like n=1 Tax=Hetaerina americana TaxID=62018 RepID=UPI003A7F25E7
MADLNSTHTINAHSAITITSTPMTTQGSTEGCIGGATTFTEPYQRPRTKPTTNDKTTSIPMTTQNARESTETATTTTESMKSTKEGTTLFPTNAHSAITPTSTPVTTQDSTERCIWGATTTTKHTKTTQEGTTSTLEITTEEFETTGGNPGTTNRNAEITSSTVQKPIMTTTNNNQHSLSINGHPDAYNGIMRVLFSTGTFTTEKVCKFCRQKDKYGTFWEACAGRTALSICPIGADGVCSWKCETTGLSFIGKTPDYSNCHNNWMDSLVNSNMSANYKAKKFEQYTNNSSFYGHEMLHIIKLLNNITDLFIQERSKDGSTTPINGDYKSFIYTLGNVINNIIKDGYQWEQIDNEEHARVGTAVQDFLFEMWEKISNWLVHDIGDEMGRIELLNSAIYVVLDLSPARYESWHTALLTLPYQKVPGAKFLGTSSYGKVPRKTGEWDETGCKLASTNETHSKCICTHLSSFAVFMQMHEYKPLCSTAGAVLHYALSASIMWMAAEGHYLYRSILRVMDATGKDYRNTYRVISYGLPAIMVIATALSGLAVGENAYGNPEVIWIRGWITLSSLLGVSWFIGLASFDSSVYFEYMFVVFNGSQVPGKSSTYADGQTSSTRTSQTFSDHVWSTINDNRNSFSSHDVAEKEEERVKISAYQHQDVGMILRKDSDYLRKRNNQAILPEELKYNTDPRSSVTEGKNNERHENDTVISNQGYRAESEFLEELEAHLKNYKTKTMTTTEENPYPEKQESEMKMSFPIDSVQNTTTVKKMKSKLEDCVSDEWQCIKCESQENQRGLEEKEAVIENLRVDLNIARKMRH